MSSGNHNSSGLKKSNALIETKDIPTEIHFALLHTALRQALFYIQLNEQERSRYQPMRFLGSDRTSISSVLVIISLLPLTLAVNYGLQNACACQCIRYSPEKYSERSDVIFLGRISSREEAPPPEVGSHITFEVLRSWKGVDTEKVTIHNGDGSSCGAFPFRLDNPEHEQYLVYATNDFSEIRVTLCGGTIPRYASGVDLELNPLLNADLYLKYLDDNFKPIELEEGHTRSVSIVPPLEILGGLLAVAAAAFIVIRRS
ncbi:MAG: hypothetical protein ACRD5H_14730 [Nitrososphaerales archaeon]